MQRESRRTWENVLHPHLKKKTTKVVVGDAKKKVRINEYTQVEVKFVGFAA